jgi:hypothetical protein
LYLLLIPYDGKGIGYYESDKLQTFGCPIYFNKQNTPDGNGGDFQLNIGTQNGDYTAANTSSP